MVKADSSQKSDTKTVARAIRNSKLLDPVLKAHWLALLPYMSAEDQRELSSILAEGDGQLAQLGADYGDSR